MAMLVLIRNENVKIFRRWRTWVFFLLTVLAVVVGAYLNASYSKLLLPSQEDWRVELAQRDTQIQQSLADPQMPLPAAARQQLVAELHVNEYRLAHNIPPTAPQAWQFANDASGLMVIVTVFVAVVAADVIAGEFASGTIKLLLIRPYRRTKFLFAKFAAVLLFAVVLTLTLAVAACLAGGIFWGFSGFMWPYVYADAQGNVHAMPMFAHVLMTYALQGINLVMIATIAFMISAVARSSALAIGLSILLLFGGTTATALLAHHAWAKYILFANTDLTQYFGGTPLVPGMTLGFSITMLVLYFVLFHVVAWWAFVRRDVAGQ
jgi:ABC-2 type transport system permease protein